MIHMVLDTAINNIVITQSIGCPDLIQKRTPTTNPTHFSPALLFQKQVTELIAEG